MKLERGARYNTTIEEVPLLRCSAEREEAVLKYWAERGLAISSDGEEVSGESYEAMCIDGDVFVQGEALSRDNTVIKLDVAHCMEYSSVCETVIASESRLFALS